MSSDDSDPISPDKVRRSYEAADKFVREVVNFRADVAIPSHNELRYAGHHFISAMSDEGSIDYDQLTKSHNHCLRAMYEAADSGIISALDIIKIFKEDYNTVTIADIVPSYAEIKKKAAAAQKLLAEPREHKEDVFIVPDAYVETFKGLVEAIATLEDAREDLNKKIVIGRKDTRYFYVQIVVGALIAVILFIVGLILT